MQIGNIGCNVNSISQSRTELFPNFKTSLRNVSYVFNFWNSSDLTDKKIITISSLKFCICRHFVLFIIDKNECQIAAEEKNVLMLGLKLFKKLDVSEEATPFHCQRYCIFNTFSLPRGQNYFKKMLSDEFVKNYKHVNDYIRNASKIC